MNRNKLIPIVYEDGGYIAFDKPAGLLVIPTPKKEKYTLSAIVNQQYSVDSHKGQLHPCHRLDRDTSGVILFARGKANQKRMMEAFKGREVDKKYIALVQGRPASRQGEIKSKIKSFEQKKFLKSSPAKLAITRYRILDFKKQFSVVEVSPMTGRTNQIRVHFKSLGHPLVGEDKYAFRRDFPLRFRRVALHAHQLSWTHPVTKKKITVTSPLPNDMEVFIAKH